MGRTLALTLAVVIVAAGCGGGSSGGSGAAPIRGEKRDELCRIVDQPPRFDCPDKTNRRGKPPPDGTEMWCQRWDGTRHGPYRRFPTGVSGDITEPVFVGDGVVVGEYNEGHQHGAWYARRPNSSDVNVTYYDSGALKQRIHCGLR